MAQEFYETAHTDWWPARTESSGAVPDRVNRVERLLRRLTPGNVLDIGFEDLHQVKWLSSIFPESCCTFVDVDRSRVRLAEEAGFQASACDVSSEVLPFHPDTFDLVVMTEVLEHLFNPDFTLNELKRVLRPQGICILSTPNLASWYNRILLAIGIQPVSSEVSTKHILGRRFRRLGQGNFPVGHIRLFTERAVRDLLMASGFEIDSLSGYYDSRIPMDRLFRAFPTLSSGFAIQCHSTSLGR